MHCLYFCFLLPAGVRRLWPWNQEDRCNISANYCFHIIQIRQFRFKRILIADPFFLSLAPSRVIFAVSIMLCDKEMPLRHDFGFMHVGKCLFQIFGTILTIVHRNVCKYTDWISCWVQVVKLKTLTSMRRPCTNRYPCKRLGKRCGTLASSLAHMWAAPPPNTPGKKHFQTGPYLPPHCYLNHWESSPLLEFLCRLPLAPLPAPWCKLEPPPRGTHSLSPFMFKFLPGDQVRISRSN